MRSSTLRLLAGLSMVLCLCTTPATACLTFCLSNGGEIIYGRNFDWTVGIGAVFVNPRHVRKVSFTPPANAPVTWTSKYGSVTFNQFSRDIPVGGMNEEGLVIECLVSAAQHPPVQGKKAITELQWIQYHLDMCKTVEEVITAAKKVGILKYAVPIHYFMTDASGRCAVIEYLDGKMVVRTGNTLPDKVLANMPYDFERKFAQSSNDGRFARAAKALMAFDGKEKPVPYAYGVLDAVSQGDFTKWQVVYDVKRRTIHFKTLSKPAVKVVNMAKLGIADLDRPLMMDVNLDGKGAVDRKFKPCTREKNEALMDESIAALQKSGLVRHISREQLALIRGIIETYRYMKPEE